MSIYDSLLRVVVKRRGILTMTVSLSTFSISSRDSVGRLSSGSASGDALSDCSESLLSCTENNNNTFYFV